MRLRPTTVQRHGPRIFCDGSKSLTRLRATSCVRRESFRRTTSFKPLSERFTIARANLGAKMADRPYLFYELTNSLCGKCLRKVEAKVVIEDDHVYLHKWCPEHRFQKVLISTDAEYYKLSRQTLKPGQMPKKFDTPIKYGCPYDCGLCPDHEQHSCLPLVEITDGCNLTCPICYSESSPARASSHRSLKHIEFMMDRCVEN